MILSFALDILIFWLVVHALFSVARRRFGPGPALLPGGPQLRTPPNVTLQHAIKLGRTRYTLDKVHLRIESSAFNDAHNELAARLSVNRESRAARVVRIFYRTGTAFGLLGMVSCVAFIGWVTIHLGYMILVGSGPVSDTPYATSNLHRRAYLPELPTSVEATDASSLQALIPGLTVPLSDLPFLVASLFASQVFHEAGHAFAAALENIPLKSVGAQLTLIVPFAFVWLHSSEGKSPFSNCQVAAAGPFHNIVLYIFLYTLSWLGVGQTWLSIMGYTDISAEGKSIMSFETGSALENHLPIGSLITHLDDTALGIGINGPVSDKWTAYLTHPDPRPIDGWCIDKLAYLDQLSSCCVRAHDAEAQPPFAQLSCFVPLSSPSATGHCLDPVPILTPTLLNYTAQANLRRCKSDASCSGDSICVRPSPAEHLMRITANLPGVHTDTDRPETKVVLWSGPREEVWDEVEVGDYAARFWFLPRSLPAWAILLVEYLKTLTLSLYLFNLLPLAPLDGGAFLRAMLEHIAHGKPDGRFERSDPELASSAEDFDIELIERHGQTSGSAPNGYRSTIQRGLDSRRIFDAETLANRIHRVVLGMCGLCMTLGLITWLKHSH